MHCGGPCTASRKLLQSTFFGRTDSTFSDSSLSWANKGMVFRSIVKSPVLDYSAQSQPFSPSFDTMDAKAIRTLADHLPDHADEKKEIYLAARELMVRSESSHDTLHRLFYSFVAEATAQIGIDLGICRTLASKPVHEWTVPQLVSQTGADRNLLDRILRALAGFCMIDQTSPTSYKATNIADTLASDAAEKTCAAIFGVTSRMMAALPAVLKKQGYRDPTDPLNTAFHAGHNTTLSPSEWITQNPTTAKIFFDYMQVQRADQWSWLDQPQAPLKYFKLSESDAAKGRPMFVDVGGGAGHQCIALREKHPQLKGRVILQEVDFTGSRRHDEPGGRVSKTEGAEDRCTYA